MPRLGSTYRNEFFYYNRRFQAINNRRRRNSLFRSNPNASLWIRQIAGEIKLKLKWRKHRFEAFDFPTWNNVHQPKSFTPTPGDIFHLKPLPTPRVELLLSFRRFSGEIWTFPFPQTRVPLSLSAVTEWRNTFLASYQQSSCRLDMLPYHK